MSRFPASIPSLSSTCRRLFSTSRQVGLGCSSPITNVRETLSVTDRAYIINEGRIFRTGTPEQLGKDAEVRRVYLGEGFSLN